MKNKILLCSLLALGACVQNGENGRTDPDPTPTPAPTFTPVSTPTVGPTATPTPVVVDPLAAQAWHLNNTGQKTYSKNAGTPGVDINLGSTQVTGSGVLVAVSDTGVEKEHPDLSPNLSIAFSKNYGLAAPYYGDPAPGDSAHGTAVSGIIAAAKNNGQGSYGIASNAILAGFRYIGPSYSLSKQVDQANGNYDIFNYSYGGYSCYFDYSPSAYISQLEYGVKNLRGGLGAIYVKAAGNEFISYQSDCDSSLSEEDGYYFGNANLEEVHSYPWTIVTAAINASGISSSYSTPGSSLWISAPGGEFGLNYPAILTTDLMGCNKGYASTSNTRNDFEDGSSENQNCDYTSTMNGTSSATPMVSGVVALLLQANPNLSWRDVKHILAKTARKVDPTRGTTSHPAGYNLTAHTYQLGWITNAAGYNFHNWYGFGSVDVSAAVAMALNYNVDLGTFKTLTIDSASNLNRSIPDNSAAGVTHSISVSQNLVIEAVQIKLNVTHSYIGDLGVEITSPSGTKSILMNINSGVGVSNIDDEILLTNAFYGENMSGIWSLKIIDGQAEDTGKLNKWSLKVFGH